MSTHPESARSDSSGSDPAGSNSETRSLPDRPNLEHLKHQAKDLLRAGGATLLTAAQREIARQYGFASWPKLKAQVESLDEIGQLKDAIDANDLERVVALMSRRPALHRAPLGYGKKMGRSLGRPSVAACPAPPSGWRSPAGCSKTAPTSTRAATGR